MTASQQQQPQLRMQQLKQEPPEGMPPFAITTSTPMDTPSDNDDAAILRRLGSKPGRALSPMSSEGSSDDPDPDGTDVTRDKGKGRA